MVTIQPGIAPQDQCILRGRRFTGVRSQFASARLWRELGRASRAGRHPKSLDTEADAGQGAPMDSPITLPEDCSTMMEVREGVDATDRALMALLDRRFGFMRAAARIKTDRAVVRDETRKATVVANARNDAEERGLPAGELAEFWERLVEISIAFELVEWDRLRNRVSSPTR